MQITRADHLPVIAVFCRRINLIEIINRIVPSEMSVSVGTIIQGMVLDTLSGRSPLYRLAEFFEHQDTELLLGEEVDHTSFNDTTVCFRQACHDPITSTCYNRYFSFNHGG